MTAAGPLADVQRVWGEAVSELPKTHWTRRELATRLYVHLLGRPPAEGEMRTALDLLGPEQRPTVAGVQDLLWALLMSPEFQYIE